MDKFVNRKDQKNDLFNKMQDNYDNKLAKKKEVYNKILYRIENLMKESATNGKDMCMYVVPEIILGLPIYNLKECLIYIKNVLTNKKFNCVIGNPNIIFIFWKLKNKIVNENNNFQKIENQSTQNIVKDIYISNNISDNNVNDEKSIKQMKAPDTFFFSH